MNTFLKMLLDTTGIDIEHLKTEYLSEDEILYLDGALKSLKDFESDFYSCTNGDRLEVLLQFFSVHKSDIIALLNNKSKESTLTHLYTSDVISASYDCFRFDLSKFPKLYQSRNQVLTLYRIGRVDESAENLGCSWSKTFDGLNAFIQSSSISEGVLTKRPIFEVQVHDSVVLFSGSDKEQELVLQAGFNFKTLKLLDTKKIIENSKINIHV
ncbi:hypothetical protein [Vibrio parahaemolyticus]|uniref:hypothetical protein n=1 Tax=Vibrio harveyi group TaxID=717610 RepID=UPI00081BCB5B|nr:hypothetical protein [Vibrio parahaemolyticus]